MNSPANRAFAERDLSVLWHPCTQMSDHEWLPLVPIRRGQGVWLEDMDGRRYLDAVSSWWVNLFGHSNPVINAAVAEQAATLEHVILAGFSHEPAVRLAERLVSITPDGLDRVFYADNGSSAVEVALKMSFHYWRNVGERGRHRFVCLANGYHGETLGALGVGDVPLYKETYAPLMNEALVAPVPDTFGIEPRDQAAETERCLNALDALLSEHAGEVCAMIVEPLVQCAGSMRMYPARYLEGVRALCDTHRVHLIADEIAVGFGRTGTMFACEQAGISPDFMCLSKGLTGGYLPLSAVLTGETVYRAFYDDYESLKGFLHSHSYTGNALCCAAALATLDLFDASDVLGENRRKAQRMREAIRTLDDHPHVGQVRQTGMILAMELVADRDGMTPYDWKQRRGLTVYQHGLDNEVLLRPLGNVVYFMPPYVIDDAEIDLMARVAIEGIERATGAGS